MLVWKYSLQAYVVRHASSPVRPNIEGLFAFAANVTMASARSVPTLMRQGASLPTDVAALQVLRVLAAQNLELVVMLRSEH